MKKAIAALLVWAVCGYGAWGLTLGWFTHHFPDQSNTDVAAGMALFGPVGLVTALGHSPYHWLTKPLTVEERWLTFHQRYPTASRESFERDYN